MSRIKDIPRGVIALGFVSLFMDISSEMIHGLLPVFLVSVVGATPVWVGLIEGLGEGAALIVKVFSGALSDRLGQRKALAVAGYSLGTLSKPLFALAGSAPFVLLARLTDRLGKGIRAAPRDALVADLTPENARGAAYGLRQSLDSVGAFVGPLLAIALMWLTGDAFRTVFWLALIPGLLAVLTLVVFVKEPAHSTAKTVPVRWRAAAQLGRGYWLVLGIGVVFMLARFSEAFLLLRAGDVGLAAAWSPAVLAALSAAFALGAYPAGWLSDKIGRGRLLAAGLAALALADVTLALAGDVWAAFLGALLWGLHLALTQGQFSALIADTAPADRRATAFGLFGLATGVTVLAASVLAGWLWTVWGAAATFWAGAGFAGLALVGLLFFGGGLERVEAG